MPRRKKTRCALVSTNKEKPEQRNAANARERSRMRVLSRAFCRLKTTLPWVPADTKLSKLDTLRLASSYISHLKGILRDESLPDAPESNTITMHPSITLTWPFGFNRCGGGGSGSGGGGSEDDSSACSWEEESNGGGGVMSLDTSHLPLSFNAHESQSSHLHPNMIINSYPNISFN